MLQQEQTVLLVPLQLSGCVAECQAEDFCILLQVT